MSTTSNPYGAPPRDPGTRTHPVPLVLGVLLALVGLPVLLGGLGLSWALATQRDSGGYFNLPTERVTTSTSALTSGVIELGHVGTDAWWSDHRLATVRVRAESRGPGSVFVGVGPTDEVKAYLAGTSYDEVSTARTNPFRYSLTRRGSEGTLASPPADQTFWTVQSSGTGVRRLVWDVKPGSYTVVVMNSDAAAGVDVDLGAGARFDFLEPTALGLVVGGTLLIVLSGVLIAFGVRRTPPRVGPPAQRAAEPVVPDPEPAPSPVHVTGHQDAHLSRGLWLVKWLLALPHWIILAFLWMVFAVTTVVAFFAILLTGRYPRPLFDLNVGIMRWTWRVQFYATSAIGTDRYPPFALRTTDYPADLDVDYPEQLSRGLVLVKWWLLAIPQLIVVGVLAGSWSGSNDRGHLVAGGLIGALTLAAGLLLLFTGRYPRPLFDLLVGLDRWVFRVLAYVTLMTDAYPPFRLDQGPSEPGPAPGAPTAPASPAAGVEADRPPQAVG